MKSIWVKGAQVRLKVASMAFAAGLACACGVSGQPGNHSTSLDTGPTYTSKDGRSEPRFPNVDVVFGLTSADGTSVTPKPGDLKLFAQGKELGTANSLRTFEQTGYGLTAILAIDASGSMRGAPLSAIHASIAKFVGQQRLQDQVEVMTFADQPQLDVPFGASPSELTKELQTVQVRGKFTVLYDGLIGALEQFKAGQPRRRQILVISDGHDEGSKNQLPDVVYKAKSLGVVIDSIGLTRDGGLYLGSLQQISQQTGGTYQYAHSAEELESLIDQGIRATRATPVAAFRTRHLAGDDKLHSVELRWQPGNLSATAFVQTPRVVDGFSNLWLWGLGGCFFAGLILLIVSWRGSRSASTNLTTPASAQITVNISPAGFDPPEPTVVIKPTPSEPEWSSTPQPIQFEERPSTPARPQLPASDSQAASAPGIISGIEHRSKTQLAVFFEAQANGPFARLEVKNGALVGAKIAMTLPSFTMGAVAGSDVVISGDPTISGRHARLLWESSILKIEDLNSTNGTFLNSNHLQAGRHLLKPGDEIRMGRTVLIIDRA